jgi:uncharacterized protein (DUF302 family)
MECVFEKELHNARLQDVLHKVSAALEREGFGIISQIDVSQTLKEELDVDFPAYRIIEACSPGLAHRALVIDKRVGSVLPCHVVVHATADGVRLIIAKPKEAIDMLGNERLEDVAATATDKLRHVFESVH